MGWSHIDLLFTNEEQDTKSLLCCARVQGKRRTTGSPVSPGPGAEGGATEEDTAKG